MNGAEKTSLDRLCSLLSKLPGIGKKTATRLVYHILETNPSYAKTIAAELNDLHESIKRCPVCGGFTEITPCSICTDAQRDHALLCVVERPQDVRIIFESNEYRGIFHVLGGLIAPLDGVGPNNLSILQLTERIRKESIKEIILALNPTIEGDTTSLYIQNYINEKYGNTSPLITRLASGLPVGGDLEYTDKLTLSRSFRGRMKF